jgi:hypothetical protein
MQSRKRRSNSLRVHVQLIGDEFQCSSLTPHVPIYKFWDVWARSRCCSSPLAGSRCRQTGSFVRVEPSEFGLEFKRLPIVSWGSLAAGISSIGCNNPLTHGQLAEEIKSLWLLSPMFALYDRRNRAWFL